MEELVTPASTSLTARRCLANSAKLSRLLAVSTERRVIETVGGCVTAGDERLVSPGLGRQTARHWLAWELIRAECRAAGLAVPGVCSVGMHAGWVAWSVV